MKKIYVMFKVFNFQWLIERDPCKNMKTVSTLALDEKIIVAAIFVVF